MGYHGNKPLKLIHRKKLGGGTGICGLQSWMRAIIWVEY